MAFKLFWAVNAQLACLVIFTVVAIVGVRVCQSGAGTKNCSHQLPSQDNRARPRLHQQRHDHRAGMVTPSYIFRCLTYYCPF